MRLASIELNNFRNIAAMQLNAVPGVNVIHGENAQGKTNIIEAIWLFTGAKSFRGAKDKEMLRFGQKKCSVHTVFATAMREQTASIELFAPSQSLLEKKSKSVHLNGVPLESAAELAGQFYAVVFSPAHLSLVREGPAFRRKFLDTAIGQLMPKYSHYLREYQRILLQRNTLLKDVAQFPQLQDTMDVWEENLAKAAASVAFCRARYVERIRPKAAQVYEGISSGRERMDLSYQCGLKGRPSVYPGGAARLLPGGAAARPQGGYPAGKHPQRPAAGRSGDSGQRGSRAPVRLTGAAAQQCAGFKDGRVQHGGGDHQRGSHRSAGRCDERAGRGQGGITCSTIWTTGRCLSPAVTTRAFGNCATAAAF